MQRHTLRAHGDRLRIPVRRVQGARYCYRPETARIRPHAVGNPGRTADSQIGTPKSRLAAAGSVQRLGIRGPSPSAKRRRASCLNAV
jgi:hypothetical protein